MLCSLSVSQTVGTKPIKQEVQSYSVDELKLSTESFVWFNKNYCVQSLSHFVGPYMLQTYS